MLRWAADNPTQLADWGRQGRARILTKHVVRPTLEEVRMNPASRSAKLRALELLELGGIDGNAGNLVR